MFLKGFSTYYDFFYVSESFEFLYVFYCETIISKFCSIIKNVSSSTSHKKNYGILANSVIYRLIKISMIAKIMRRKFCITNSLTSKLIEGHIRSPFYLKIFL